MELQYLEKRVSSLSSTTSFHATNGRHSDSANYCLSAYWCPFTIYFLKYCQYTFGSCQNRSCCQLSNSLDSDMIWTVVPAQLGTSLVSNTWACHSTFTYLTTGILHYMVHYACDVRAVFSSCCLQ